MTPLMLENYLIVGAILFGLGMVGWVGLLIAIGAGGGGALLLLVTSWKPAPAQQAAGS